jgi:hypothetical protein
MTVVLCGTIRDERAGQVSKRPKSATVQVGLRLKEPLRAKLELEAKANGVSLNAEIVKRLELSLFSREITRDLLATVDKKLDRYQGMVDEAQKFATKAIERTQLIQDVIAEAGPDVNKHLKDAAVRLRKKREGSK